jgi:hypothetical protein
MPSALRARLLPEPEAPATAGIVARYDASGDGRIEHAEYMDAVDDYDDGLLTITEMLQVRKAYLSS